MSPPAVTLGAAADIDAVMAVMDCAFDPLFGEAWSRGQCLGILSLTDVWLSLATLGERIEVVGFALSRRTLEEAELLLLAVHPSARCRGVGRALVDHSVTEARTRGAGRLMLEVRAGNPALRLYDAIGFGAIGRRRGYYRGRDGSLHDAITLSRPLMLVG